MGYLSETKMRKAMRLQTTKEPYVFLPLPIEMIRHLSWKKGDKIIVELTTENKLILNKL